MMGRLRFRRLYSPADGHLTEGECEDCEDKEGYNGGDAGMKRWVGLGVIADNLINIGRALHKQVESAAP
jgi:hypothetical protein